MIKQEKAIRDTLNRLNASYGRGKIEKFIFNGYADFDKTVATWGNVIITMQYGRETKRFDLFTHGNGKIGIQFRGRYRVVKEG